MGRGAGGVMGLWPHSLMGSLQGSTALEAHLEGLPLALAMRPANSPAGLQAAHFYSQLSAWLQKSDHALEEGSSFN